MESKQKVLENLVRARAAIKHKLELLKANKYEKKKMIDETFRPIREPLEKLIELKSTKKKRKKRKKKNKKNQVRWEKKV